MGRHGIGRKTLSDATCRRNSSKEEATAEKDVLGTTHVWSSTGKKQKGGDAVIKKRRLQGGRNTGSKCSKHL